MFMKTILSLLAVVVSTAAFATSPATPAPMLAAPAAAPANPHAGMSGMAAPQAITLSQKGKVISSIDVPTYTYIEVAQGKKKIWLATSTTAVKKGDMIRFDNGMTMTNFYSKGLKRNFPSILFANKVVVDKGAK